MGDFTMIDLSGFYTNTLDEEIHHKPGNDLRAMPHGVSEFAGVPFDVNGIIQLSGEVSKEKTSIDFPPAILGIPIGASGRVIHFLHCSSWHDEVGTKVGEYRVHYADGEVGTIPIVYGQHVLDWWFMEGDPLPDDAEVAWTGDNERTRDLGHSIQLYKYSWDNPRPEARIETLDFVSNEEESAPFLAAVTVE